MYINLSIKKGTSITEIERDFTLYYPYLKIEFYNNELAKEQPSLSKVSGGNFHSSRLTRFTQDCTISISSNKTINELEKECACIGLSVKVFRKAGNVCIEASLTNDWTLQHQNYEAEQISKPIAKNLPT